MSRTAEQVDTDLANLEKKLEGILNNPGFFPPVVIEQVEVKENEEPIEN